MNSRYLKSGLAGIALIAGAVFGYMVLDMSQMSMVTLIQCSAGEGGIRIPSELCEYYMKNHRGDQADMEELAIGGLDPILNLQNSKKYEIAAFFIAKGMDVNGINHYYFASQTTSRRCTPACSTTTPSARSSCSTTARIRTSRASPTTT